MNYMGSKQRIAKYLIPILQNEINKNKIKTYIEPFVGGANVIDKITCEHKIGYDINPYLIALHQHAQKDLSFPKTMQRERYNLCRESYNKQDGKYKDWQYGCAGFLGSMNGRFFDGGYAVNSHNRDFYREKKDNLLKQAKQPLYKNIYFGVSDFKKIPNFENVLIYCDPPYEGTKQYGINKKFNHKEFWEWVREKSWNNIVYVSEQNAPDDFVCVWEHKVLRTIKVSADKSYATEKLFVYRG